eukprot:m.5766 g.5766  ORF g.5766 m.5766 type:complete len:657 (+) comp3394_c0_seq1:31-2001(+)
MNVFALLILLHAVVVVNGKNSTCTPLQPNSCWQNPGAHVVGTFATISVQECCSKCDANAKCIAWTLNFAENNGTCFLKDGMEITPHPGNCTSAGTILPPPPPPPLPPAIKGAKNVLFIAVDDLRPELGAYGSHVPTPNLDAFSKTALTFENAYVQYSFCCPSRNSFMTGRRPSTTKVWNFIDNFREVGQNWISMPEWFKVNGYFTHGLGKLFHPQSPPNYDPPSWSDPKHVTDGNGQVPVTPNQTINMMHTRMLAQETSKGSSGGGPCITGERGGSYCELPEGESGPDDELMQNAVESVYILGNFSKSSGHPFFLGVGFHKPHIPWTIPTRFFQPLPSINDTILPLHERPPVGMPPIAWNKGLGRHALDSYADANEFPLHSFENGSWVAFPHNQTKAMRRGYYAAVSYVDYLIGEVLNALESTGLADNTVVAFMGDHGYNLGELNLWCKMTVFESGVHVPLMIRVPWYASLKGQRTSSLAEAVDLFPTLVELATPANAPEYCEGNSLAPIFKTGNTSLRVKEGAYSEFVKCFSCCRVPDNSPCLPGGAAGRCNVTNTSDLHEMGNCFHVPREEIDFIGYSVRDSQYRYTEWLHFNGTILHGDFNRMVGRELYNHSGDIGGNHNWDEFENVNIAEQPGNAELVAHYHALLMKGFPTQ